jgi:sugar/nucleoside kinase (ribokinase family)
MTDLAQVVIHAHTRPIANGFGQSEEGRLVGSAAEIDAVMGGSVFCDLVFSGLNLPRPGAEVFADGFALTPGGTATRAVAAARCGLSTALRAVVGTDIFGQRVAELLAAEHNVDLRWLERHPAAHTPLTVAVANEHDRAFITYEEPGTTVPEDWPGDLPAATTCHIGLGRPVPEWVGRLREGGTTVFGGVGWDATGTWSPDVLERLDDVDVFVPNEVEAMRYTRTDDVVAAVKQLAERAGTAVVTRGGQGAIAADAATGEWVDLPAVEVDVVDPTGAGDVFVAGLMAATVQAWDITTRVRFAGLLASLSVRTIGGAMSAPRPGDVLRFLRERRPAGNWVEIEDWALLSIEETT